MSDLTFTIDESARQMFLLALAVLTKRSPGFDHYNGTLADALCGRKMYEDFKTCNSHLGEWPTISGAAPVPMTEATLADATKAVALAAPDSPAVDFSHPVEEWAPPEPIAENVSAEQAENLKMFNRLPNICHETLTIKTLKESIAKFVPEMEALNNQAYELCRAIEKLTPRAGQKDLAVVAGLLHAKIQKMWVDERDHVVPPPPVCAADAAEVLELSEAAARQMGVPREMLVETAPVTERDLRMLQEMRQRRLAQQTNQVLRRENPES